MILEDSVLVDIHDNGLDKVLGPDDKPSVVISDMCRQLLQMRKAYQDQFKINQHLRNKMFILETVEQRAVELVLEVESFNRSYDSDDLYKLPFVDVVFDFGPLAKALKINTEDE